MWRSCLWRDLPSPPVSALTATPDRFPPRARFLSQSHFVSCSGSNIYPSLCRKTKRTLDRIKSVRQGPLCCSSAEAGKGAPTLGIDVPRAGETCAGPCAAPEDRGIVTSEPSSFSENHKARRFTCEVCQEGNQTTPKKPFFRNYLGELMMEGDCKIQLGEENLPAAICSQPPSARKLLKILPQGRAPSARSRLLSPR